MPVVGPWVDLTIGLDDARVELAMMRTPDGLIVALAEELF